MSEVLLVCRRSGTMRLDVAALAARLAPHGVTPRYDVVHTAADSLVAVLQPTRASRTSSEGVALGAGAAVGPGRPGDALGVFDHVAVRTSVTAFEAVADPVASRTLWWADDGDLFAVSTSQRAIVAALGTYVPDGQARAWMLSSGTLGPNHGWDRRIRPVPPGGSLRFDRRSGETEMTAPPIEFVPERMSARRAGELLAAPLHRVAEHLQALDADRWFLALSGGVDSRALAVLDAGDAPLRAVTWGAPGSPSVPGTDAYVAARLAEHLGVQHAFIPLDPGVVDPAVAIERFVDAGEGRIDQIGGYVDGMRLWRDLHDAGLQGLLRGDEAFGWVACANEFGVRRSVGLVTLRDLGQVDGLRDELFEAWGPQAVPVELRRRDDETLATWRDRLYHAFRFPVVLAGLTSVKTGHLEVAAPLVDAELVALVRRLPDRLRTEKRAFRNWVAEHAPALGFASRHSQTSVESFVRAAPVRTRLADELAAGGLLPDRLVATVRSTLLAPSEAGASPDLLARAARFAPPRVRRIANDRLVPARVDVHRLAFRAWIIARMDATLRADAILLRR